MAITKNAMIRYLVLDKCFGNTGREYTFEDLLDECNNALLNANPHSSGISVRSIRNDMKFMKSEEGYAADIDVYSGVKGKCYKYIDSNFSIRRNLLKEEDKQQLSAILEKLSQFEGLPSFEWLDNMAEKIDDSLNPREGKRILGFEENIFLKGKEYISVLYDAITYKKQLDIRYKPYRFAAKILRINPCYLKQYNNRWFLFGYEKSRVGITNIALDRIENIIEVKGDYVLNADIDFEEYFDDIIGVTRIFEKPIERVILRISESLWPYIETKPIHGSQKIINRNEEYVDIELRLILNYELESVILSHGEKIEVLEPLVLKYKIKSRIEEAFRNYIR